MSVEIEDRNPEVALLLGIACAIGSVVGFIAFTFKGEGAMAQLWDAAGSVTFFLILLFLPAIYFLYNGQLLFRYRSEFHRKMDTKSKARFLSEIDRIEYLVWKLGHEYGDAVKEKRKALGIKRKK